MQKINELMQKEMTRKEFLATVGFGIASIFGLSAIIKLLTSKESPLGQRDDYGYGGGPYGGRKV